MKYLGIDYGIKKVGIAISDDMGKIAFPKIILLNGENLFFQITDLIEKEKVQKIIIGKSVDMSGVENPIQREIDRFADKLEQQTKCNIEWEKEWMSSVAARGHLYGKGNIENERWTGKENQKRREPIDAAAAAIILQRYLDKINRV